jgi:sigma-B regulation protein RsbU (phosphoserine phosphatase)
VTKPLDFPVVLARIRTQLALRRAVTQVKELEARLDTHNRELRAAAAHLTAANDQHTRDLEAAARIQRAFLPTLPPEWPGARFAWAFEPSHQLTGDYLNVFRLGDRQVGLCVLDVGGHGVAAALLSLTVSQMLGRIAGQGRLLPAGVAAQLGRELTVEATGGQSVSLLYGVLDLNSGEFRFVSAGHPGPIHLAMSRPAVRLDAAGFPLGVGPGEPKEHTVTLKPGDRLVLYSDGLTSVRNGEGEHFGTQRILAALDAARDKPLAEHLARLVQDVESWRGQTPRHDDISVLLVERTEPMVAREAIP